MTPSTRKAVIVAALAGCIAMLLWMFLGKAAGQDLIGNANVVGGLAGAAALMLAVAVLWPKQASTMLLADVDARLASAVDYLARAALAALSGSRLLARVSERLLIWLLRQVRAYFTDITRASAYDPKRPPRETRSSPRSLTSETRT